MLVKKICPQCKNKRAIAEGRKICWSCRRFNSDINLGRILTPDYKDVETSPFKEPMLKVKGGYGYYGAVTTTKDGKFIQCHICGYYFKHLTRHVMYRHEVAGREYKLTHGLRIRDGLLSPVAKEEAIQRFNKVREKFGTRESNRKAHAASKAKREAGLKVGGDMWTSITRNERALCKDQLLAKIQQVARANEGIVTVRLMSKEFGREYRDTIKTQFGSWPKALKEAGVYDYTEKRRRENTHFMFDAISKIKAFYKEHGHPPYTADFNVDPDLPSQSKVSKHFGTLNNARRLARVPEVIYVGNHWEEVMYERQLVGSKASG